MRTTPIVKVSVLSVSSVVEYVERRILIASLKTWRSPGWLWGLEGEEQNCEQASSRWKSDLMSGYGGGCSGNSCLVICNRVMRALL